MTNHVYLLFFSIEIFILNIELSALGVVKYFVDMAVGVVVMCLFYVNKMLDKAKQAETLCRSSSELSITPKWCVAPPSGHSLNPTLYIYLCRLSL